MFNNILKLINTQGGKYLISIVFGIGLACIFKKSCQTRNCLKFIAPDINEIKSNVYKYNNKCYTFSENAVSCQDKKRKQVRFK